MWILNERGFLCRERIMNQGIQGKRCVESNVMGVYPLYCPDCSSSIFLLGQLEQRTILFLWLLSVFAGDIK